MTPLSSASQLFLELDPDLRASSWQAGATHPPDLRWQTYLNRLCLYGALPWLAELGFDPDPVDSVARSHDNIWRLTGGTAVTLGDGARLVLLPSEAMDRDELRIPQEWVDIPGWASDYYVGARVSPDADLLCLWGYATHAQIKQRGQYDPQDRSYSLADMAVGDLAILPVTRALCPSEATRLGVPPLPALPPAQAEALIQRLAASERRMLRLAVPFSLWGALLENPEWRSRLYEARCGRQPQPGDTPTNLGQWLRSLGQDAPADWLTQGWQLLETLLPASPEMSMAFRDAESGTVCGGKRLILGRDATVLLLVSAETEADGRISVRVQLWPGASLPNGIELSLLSPSGEVVQTVQKRAGDDYIQLKRFRLPPGYPFAIQVRLGAQTVLEPFTT